MCDRAVETPIPAPEREEVDSICFAGETNVVGWGSRPARPLRDIGPTRLAPTWLGLADLPPFRSLSGGRHYRRYQIRTFWAFMPQGRLLPLSWLVGPCLRSARPFALVGPLRATSALPVTRMASGFPSTSP